MSDPLQLIPEIKQLCKEHRYDEAIKKTDELVRYDFGIAVKAHLLVIEHEKNYLKDQTGAA